MLLLLVLPGCGRESTPPNVLLLVADDLGVDMVGAYGLGEDRPPTPNLDALADEGVLFRNAWSNPACSPTRAGLLTGRHAFRTGIGWVIAVNDDIDLPVEEVILPEVLDAHAPVPYRHAAFGKWHLSADPEDLAAPNRAGFAHFDGSLFNFIQGASYYAWPRVINGQEVGSERYATTETVDAVVDWIKRTPQPWFAYVAFHAPHNPYEAPPSELHHVDVSEGDERSLYRAMVEALDSEIGRLLREIGPERRANTVVIFLGDNGTPAAVTVPPFVSEHGKSTLYQGGIAVPLIVSGAGLAARGSESEALVHTTDVFSTVVELAGIDASALEASGPTRDSMSLVPYLRSPNLPSQRATLFSEEFRPSGNDPSRMAQAIRGPRYKLIMTAAISDQPGPDGRLAWDVSQGLFDLETDPHEQANLLSPDEVPPTLNPIYLELREALRRVRAQP